MPWLLIVVPCVPEFTVAVMVIVTLPPSGASVPSQLTVLPVVAAVPPVAVALTRVRPDGRASVNSCPALSFCAPVPLLVIVTV